VVIPLAKKIHLLIIFFQRTARKLDRERQILDLFVSQKMVQLNSFLNFIEIAVQAYEEKSFDYR
jgi:hypothetical protein